MNMFTDSILLFEALKAPAALVPPHMGYCQLRKRAMTSNYKDFLPWKFLIRTDIWTHLDLFTP